MAAKDYIWGVSSETKAFIGHLKIRLSIKDVHLLFQIVAYAGDSITNESVSKLKEIHDNIEERENIQQALEDKKKSPMKKGHAAAP